MADATSSKIINQIQAIISDQLQVVSYKWLSRNFLVPSNEAKRLLQEFVERHGSGLEVIYAISGWLKSEPQCYSVQLVPKAKLEDVKAEFVDACSTHVYSVQPCLPKDPAELWSAEFVQAEELFNQATSIVNCLRDNRFSAVSCSLVKHGLTGKNMYAAPPVPETDMALASTTNEFSKNSVLPQQHVSPPLQKSVETSSKAAAQASTLETDVKIGSDMKDVSGQNSVRTADTAKIPTSATNKKKGQNGKGTGGALASLWSRASSKAMPSSSPPPANNVKDVLLPTVNAEVQCDSEAAGHISSDDDAEDFSCIRRSHSNNGSGRKRRVVFNMSDDENEDEIFDSETVISLASPELPKQRSGSKSDIETKISTGMVQGNKDISEGQRVDKTKAAFSSKPTTSSSKSLNDIQPAQTRGKGKGKINYAADNKNANASNLKENVVCPAKVVNNEDETVHTECMPSGDTLVSKTATKKRKILKTHIDDRGREVTEIASEADGVEPEKVEDVNHPVKKSSASGCDDNQLQATAKGQSAEHNPPANRTRKTNSKHAAKGAGKDTRQGNILSFYKRT